LAPTPNRKPSVQLTDDAVGAALHKTHGNISAAARSLSCTRRAIQIRIEKSAELQQIVTDARESMVDLAESALRRAVKEGDGWAVCFTLKCLGKARGYIERPGDEGGGAGGPLTLNINILRVEVPAGPAADGAAAAAPPTVLPPIAALPAPTVEEPLNGEGH
jgi:hypothetical protein